MNLIIADADRAYVDSLAGYLTAHFPLPWEISTFDQDEILQEYITRQGGSHVILLKGSTLGKNLSTAHLGLVLDLVERKVLAPEIERHRIYKYQRGDKLIANILNAYATENPQMYLPLGEKKTRLIAVYSPTGGSGKTTVALGASIQSSMKGKEVLYLNFESISSTPLYFSAEGPYNLSSLLCYLRETQGDILAAKLEKARCQDPQTQVYYYQPPASLLDLNEDLTAEMRLLLKALTDSRLYDLIYIDMSVALNANNLLLLEACDEIDLVVTDDPLSQVKMLSLEREWQALAQRYQVGFMHKVRVVHNMVQGASQSTFVDSLQPATAPIKIPWIEGILISQGKGARLDMNSPLGEALYPLTAGHGG